MNQINVCSHWRSGTHLIMAYLFENYIFKGNLDVLVSAATMRWAADPKHTGMTRVPWGGLFGSHEKFTHQKPKLNNILYIYRHPLDVLKAHWQFSPTIEPCEKWIVKDRVKFWYDHVQSYVGNSHMVKFEDLIEPLNTINVVTKAAAAFKLNLKPTAPFRLIHEQVGWIPALMPTHAWNQSYVADLVKQVVPHGFMGYNIKDL